MRTGRRSPSLVRLSWESWTQACEGASAWAVEGGKVGAVHVHVLSVGRHGCADAPRAAMHGHSRITAAPNTMGSRW